MGAGEGLYQESLEDKLQEEIRLTTMTEHAEARWGNVDYHVFRRRKIHDKNGDVMKTKCRDHGPQNTKEGRQQYSRIVLPQGYPDDVDCSVEGCHQPAIGWLNHKHCEVYEYDQHEARSFPVTHPETKLLPIEEPIGDAMYVNDSQEELRPDIIDLLHNGHLFRRKE